METALKKIKQKYLNTNKGRFTLFISATFSSDVNVCSEVNSNRLLFLTFPHTCVMELYMAVFRILVDSAYFVLYALISFVFSCNWRQVSKFNYKYNMNFKSFITSCVVSSVHTTCLGLHWPSSGVKISIKTAALLYLLFPASYLLSEV
jgi:hypothetical protein